MSNKTEKTFLHFVGRASTSASIGGRSLGRNVSVAAYELADGEIMLMVESNGSRVKSIPSKVMSREQYEDFCGGFTYNDGGGLMVKALESFGCTTPWSDDE